MLTRLKQDPRWHPILPPEEPLNKAIVSGHLGQDPELRYTGNKTPVATFRIASSERRKQNDQWVEVPEWHTIIAWGKTAEACSKYLRKGSKALVEGRLQTSSYEDKHGVKRFKTEIIADAVEFLTPPKDKAPDDDQLPDLPPQSQAPTPNTWIDDDIPF